MQMSIENFVKPGLVVPRTDGLQMTVARCSGHKAFCIWFDEEDKAHGGDFWVELSSAGSFQFFRIN